MKLILELVDLDDVQRLDHQQRIHEESIALVRRYAAGGSMGAGDKTHFLKVSHYVSYGSGAQIKAGEFGKRARTYRLTFGDIPFDQSLKQDFCALI